MADRPVETIEEASNSEKISDLILTENPRGFAPSDLIECRKCGRKNPPDRTGCLYCGHDFENGLLNTTVARVSYKSPEPWEDGFSIVFAGDRKQENLDLSVAADLLRLNESSLKEMLSIGCPVPLIYLRSLNDAQLLGSRLSEAGFDCAVVGDDLLQSSTPPTRLRTITFIEKNAVFVDFNTLKQFDIDLDERILIVIGSITRTSMERSGKVKKRAFATSTEVHSVTDETVIDLYPKSDVFGFRLRASGFDFSGLGDRMKQFASSNVAEMLDQLRVRFRSAIFIDGFRATVPLIADIWPPVETHQATEVSRGTLGGVHKRSLNVMDNTKQFTRFSRLQRHFI